LEAKKRFGYLIMYINLSKWGDFVFIILSSFIVAYSGEYFFGWDFSFGLMVGIALGIWNSIFDLGYAILEKFMPDEETEDIN
jgi:preprotein translocase subunit SecF